LRTVLAVKDDDIAITRSWNV